MSVYVENRKKCPGSYLHASGVLLDQYIGLFLYRGQCIGLVFYNINAIFIYFDCRVSEEV